MMAQFLFDLDQGVRCTVWLEWMDCYRLRSANIWEVEYVGSNSFWLKLLNLRSEILAKNQGPLIGVATRRDWGNIVYELFCPTQHIVVWKELVWNHYNIPKVAILSWLACRGRLANKG